MSPAGKIGWNLGIRGGILGGILAIWALAACSSAPRTHSVLETSPAPQTSIPAPRRFPTAVASRAEIQRVIADAKKTLAEAQAAGAASSAVDTMADAQHSLAEAEWLLEASPGDAIGIHHAAERARLLAETALETAREHAAATKAVATAPPPPRSLRSLVASPTARDVGAGVAIFAVAFALGFRFGKRRARRLPPPAPVAIRPRERAA